MTDVLYVPRLAISLFSANKFAREHKGTHFEVMEYLERRWTNRHTSAVEFTATIHGNNLAYVNWSVDAALASAYVTLEELHARLNHTPYPALRDLVRRKFIRGLPTHVAGPRPSGEFGEDYVSGGLTRAPHTKLAARAKEPLARVYVQSRRSNPYWVTFVDDYSRFPAVYFVRRKSDVVRVFKRYRA